MRKGEEIHRNAAENARHRAVGKTEQHFLPHERPAPARLDVPQRDAAHRDRKRLAAGIARLPREHRQEGREDHQLVEGALEDRDHASRGERGDEVDEKPRIAIFEALPDRVRDALFLLHADHRAGLRGDLEGLELEERRAAHQADQAAFGVGHGILRIVLVDRELHRVGQRQAGRQRKWIGEHHVRQARLALVEEEVAHRDEAAQLAVGVDHVDVGHEGAPHQGAQRLDRLAYRHVGAEHRQRRFHQLADGALRICPVALPLLGHFRGRGGGDEASRPRLELAEDVLHDRRIQLQQRFHRFGWHGALHHGGSLIGRQGSDLGCERRARVRHGFARLAGGCFQALSLACLCRDCSARA